MRACHFCAEPIQDAAVFCKHCRRDIPHGATATAFPSQPAGYTPHVQSAPTKSAPHQAEKVIALPKAGTTRSSLTQRLLLLLLIGVLVLAVYRREQGAGEGGVAGLFTPTRVIGIAVNQELDVPAGGIQKWEWTTLPNQPVCRLTGHIQVTDGGNRDVRVFVMTGDDYANMVNGHESRVAFQTDQLTAVDLDVVTRTPGRKVLAISNNFSVFTGKHVELRKVQVACQ